MKIIASDYDGTLNHHGIADHVRAALLKWQARGNKFGIVSGRGIYNILGVVKREAVACDFFVANNGAVIADGEGKILLCHTASPTLAVPIARFILENGGAYACLNDLTGDTFLCRDEDKETRYMTHTLFYALSAFDKAIAFTQISTVCADEHTAEMLTAKINDSFAADVSAFQNGICIDIVPAGVDKAKGIEDLLTFYAASQGDVCTVGDNNNDLAMLKAYRSYAVQNAIPIVKKIADEVVCDLAELVERELNR